MRFSLRNVSLGLALASFATVGFASAQTLVGVNARLDHTISSQSAKVGETVTAKLKEKVTVDGVKLPKNTTLIGTVTEAKSSENRGPSSLVLTFTEAELKGGKKIKVKATVIAAYPADQADQSVNSNQFLPLPPATVSSDFAADQSGALGKISLSSSAQKDSSVTFTQKKGNFRLDAGTYLQMGIGTSAD